MSNLLIKTTDKGYEKVYPKTYSEQVIDKSSGKNLTEILNSCNMYFLPFLVDLGDTRLQIPEKLRRKGLYVTYENPVTNTITTELYNSDEIDNINWVLNKNWIEVPFLIVLVSGNSTHAVMSQNAITQLILDLSDRITALENA